MGDMIEEPDRLDIAAAVARMSRTVSVRRELRGLPALLDPGETVEAIVRGTDGAGFGLLVLTGRRLFFVREGLVSRRLHLMALNSVASVAWSHDRGSGELLIDTVAGRFVLQGIGRHDGGPFADAVRRRLGGHLPVSGAVPVARIVRYPGLPTLLTSGREQHLVVDPATVTARHRVDDRGAVHRELSAAERAGVLVGLVVVLALLGGLVGLSAGAFAGWAITVGIVSAVIVAGKQQVILGAVAAALPRPGAAPVRVEPGNTQAWELCTVAGRLTATTAWQQGLVDATRRVPELLWSAARRSVVLDAEQSDVERAQAHGSLHDLARQTGERIAAERAAIDAVLQNLRGVLGAAEAVDQLGRDQLDAARARREEIELRNRMLRTHDPLAREQSHERADGAAGLAAESAEIARLLAVADRYLE